MWGEEMKFVARTRAREINSYIFNNLFPRRVEIPTKLRTTKFDKVRRRGF